MAMPKLSRYLGSRNEANALLVDRKLAQRDHGVPATQTRDEIHRSGQVRHARWLYASL